MSENDFVDRLDDRTLGNLLYLSRAEFPKIGGKGYVTQERVTRELSGKYDYNGLDKNLNAQLGVSHIRPLPLAILNKLDLALDAYCEARNLSKEELKELRIEIQRRFPFCSDQMLDNEDRKRDSFLESEK